MTRQQARAARLRLREDAERGELHIMAVELSVKIGKTEPECFLMLKARQRAHPRQLTHLPPLY